MSGTSPNFVGNASALDQLSALSVVGSSRIIEVDYTSSSFSSFVGNFTPTAKMSLSLGTGSRIPEVDYISALGN
jgi:hypothetical protein